jgi:hypothetical protein
MQPTSAAARSTGPARRGPPGSPGASTAAGMAWRVRAPLSPPLACCPGGVASCGAEWANQAAQQKLNAQFTRTWWRRMARSERTWKSAQAQLVLDLLIALLDPVPDAVEAHDFGQARSRVRAADLAGAAGRGRLVTRYQVALSGRVPGSAVATTRRRASSGPSRPARHQPPTRSRRARLILRGLLGLARLAEPDLTARQRVGFGLYLHAPGSLGSCSMCLADPLGMT